MQMPVVRIAGRKKFRKSLGVLQVGFYPFREPDASLGAVPAYYRSRLTQYTPVDLWHPATAAGVRAQVRLLRGSMHALHLPRVRLHSDGHL
jgi:hypothetical protein